MSFQGDVETRCPACTEPFEAPVWSFVNGETDPVLRDRVKARECNLLLCPKCGEAFIPDTSWVYYEPAAEILAFVFPESWRAEEGKWRAKMKEDFEKMRPVLQERLSAEFEPEVFFGQDGIAELLEKEDWRVDERDVMRHYAQDLGLKVFKASPRWARLHDAPFEFPYAGALTRASLIEGMKALVKANDRLTAWSSFLAKLEKDRGAGVPPAAKA